MFNVHCTKCGKLASSKCPFCRSIFSWAPDDATEIEKHRHDIVSALENRILLDDEKRLSFKIFPPNETPDEFLARLQAWLPLLTPEDLKIVVCQHDWDFRPGQKSEIGCGHKSEEEVE